MSGKTLILGLGNPILGDDGAGWQIAQQTAEAIARLKPNLPVGRPEVFDDPWVEVDCLAIGGLSLMERMIGYDRVILIDAISTGLNPAGAVLQFSLDALPEAAGNHLNTAHDTSLQNALRIGRKMGAALPGQIEIVAVEAQSLYEFSEELTPPIAAAVPSAVQSVLELTFGPEHGIAKTALV